MANVYWWAAHISDTVARATRATTESERFRLLDTWKSTTFSEKVFIVKYHPGGTLFGASGDAAKRWGSPGVHDHSTRPAWLMEVGSAPPWRMRPMSGRMAILNAGGYISPSVLLSGTNIGTNIIYTYTHLYLYIYIYSYIDIDMPYIIYWIYCITLHSIIVLYIKWHYVAVYNPCSRVGSKGWPSEYPKPDEAKLMAGIHPTL